MNDAVRAAINARLKEKDMSRSDLARAVGRVPQEVTRALNGTKGGGTIPPLWAAMLDALGLALVAVPVESVTGGPVTLPSDPSALEREISERVTRAVREALSTQAGSKATPQDDGGSAGGQE